MKKKGFTLIELLAIVIILGIVAVIATPIIIDIIGDARRKANYVTAVNLIKAADNYYAESLIDPVKRINIRNISNIYNDVDVQGKRPAEGELYVNNKGYTALSVEIDNVCYVKNFYGQLEEKDDCTLGYKGVDETNPTISYEITGTKGNNNWYTSNAYVNIAVDDTEAGVDYYLWCTGKNCVPTNREIINKTVAITDTTESQVCVEVYDKAGNNYSKCSDLVKVDTIKPEITGIGDLTVARNASVNLTATATDVTSDITSFTYTPTSINTSKAGVYNVVYTAIDKAGNSKEITRKIIVETTAPSINYAVASGAINSNGWANDDFYVTISVTDNSGHGIKEFKVCTATTNTCNPESGTVITNATTATRLISTESNNNRICVQAKDNYNQLSEVICSDAYKLDKTKPTAGTINITGTKGTNDWYTSNVSVAAVNGSDALSGHDTTSVDVTSITSDTAGTKVTVTTIDKAGNSATREYTIKVDKNTPTVNIAKTVSNNQNVFTATVTPSTTTSEYSYQWYKGTTAISGATSSSYTTAEAGTYKVKVTTGAGKEATSNEITVHSYTITYNVNGGTGTIANMTKIEDITLTLTNVVPTRSNYEFKGWSTTASGSVEYAASGTYTANSDVTLYAVWQASYYCSVGTLTQSGSSYICVANNPTSSTSSTQTGCGSTNRGSACSTYNSESACERYACQFNSSSCRDYSCNCHEYGGKWENCYDFYDVIYSYTTTYSCPSGWSYYSGSGSGTQCYRAATR